jgi:hypothetical protein
MYVCGICKKPEIRGTIFRAAGHKKFDELLRSVQNGFSGVHMTLGCHDLGRNLRADLRSSAEFHPAQKMRDNYDTKKTFK